MILLLELLLVEDLDGQDGIFIGATVSCQYQQEQERVFYGRSDVLIETLVPIGAEGTLRDARGPRLFAIDRGYGKGIGQS